MGEKGLELRCRTRNTFSPALQSAREPLFAALKDETDSDIAFALLAWEILGGLDDHPGTFHCLVRNIGPASTEIQYEIRTANYVFHYESLEHMSESWQSTERPLFIREFYGLPAGVSISITCDHRLFPTHSVSVTGISPDAAERIVSRIRNLFATVELQSS